MVIEIEKLVSTAQKLVVSAGANIDEAQRKMDEAEDLVEQLDTCIQELLEKNADLEDQLSVANNDRDSLRDEVKALQKELDARAERA